MTNLASWKDECGDVLRGIAGAFLFGAPLLYTMEIWSKGSYTKPPHMLLALVLTYAALVALDRAVGFRRQNASTWWRSCTDSAEGLTIGLLTATIGLVLLRRITFDMSLDVILGHIVMESVPFSIGVGIASGLLSQGDDQEGDQEEAHHADATNESSKKKDSDPKDTTWRGTLVDAGSTLLGAAIIALSIAPTDEVPMISASMSPLWLLAVIVVSLLLSYIIVFEADFVSQKARRDQQGMLQSPLGETVFSYLLSIGAAALMLWFFQVVRTSDPWSVWLTYTIVLGLPATLGGAAGRLAI